MGDLSGRYKRFVLYSDRFVSCGEDGLEIRFYYFPAGTKKIAYSSIHRLFRVDMSATRGRARIWGTANPGYWASLDPSRPRKKVALVLDTGRSVRPFLTPEDPAAVAAIIAEKSGIAPEPLEPAPFI